MYQYLLFDLDGTLTDPKEGITKSVQYALRHYGIEEPDLDKLVPFIGPPLIPSFREFYGFGEEQAREAVEVYREYFSTRGWAQNRVLEGIPQLLTKLKEQGKVLAVASSKPEIYVERILDRFALDSFFDQVVGASMDEQRSEKADVIREAFRRIPITGDELPKTVMIGDRKHDIIGAKACGIAGIGVYTGFAPAGELEAAGASVVCHGIRDLSRVLLGETDERENNDELR